MAELSAALKNFSAEEPVMAIVSREYENFRGLVKTSDGITNPQGREWSEFVDGVRETGKEYREGERSLHRALIRLMNFAKQAPGELQSVFQYMVDGLLEQAQSRYNRFYGKFGAIHLSFKDVNKLFVRVEESVQGFRDTAADRAAEFDADIKFLRSLGNADEIVEIPGFIRQLGMDHWGADITCGDFSALGKFALSCLHDARCVGFSTRYGKPWCMKSRLNGGYLSARHDFYIKSVDRSTKHPISIADAGRYLKRWTSAWLGMKAVEDAVRDVAKKVAYIQEQLEQMRDACDEMQGMIRVDAQARERVEELMDDIGSSFVEVVNHIKPHV